MKSSLFFSLIALLSMAVSAQSNTKPPGPNGQIPQASPVPCSDYQTMDCAIQSMDCKNANCVGCLDDSACDSAEFCAISKKRCFLKPTSKPCTTVCPSTHYCHSGTCLTKQNLGQVCYGNNGCKSGRCSSFKICLPPLRPIPPPQQTYPGKNPSEL
jgi:hypothetical protein